MHNVHAPPKSQELRITHPLQSAKAAEVGKGSQPLRYKMRNYWALKVKLTSDFVSFAPMVTVWSCVPYFSCQASMV